MVCLKITISDTVKVTALTGYCSTNAGNFGFALYTDDGTGSYPGSLLAQTAIQNDSTGSMSGLVTLNISPVTITPGTYWITAAVDSNKVGITNVSTSGPYNCSYSIVMSDYISNGFPQSPGIAYGGNNFAPMVGLTYTCP
jgi:hypothetical protein